ncbi:hypothetical protein BGZ60DRAFT_559073 [Tricladium varicosporioides]|nr:hypothetical protein BGZ60DRAFT_559073 [Hymenoscyphus varicosporioides]
MLSIFGGSKATKPQVPEKDVTAADLEKPLPPPKGPAKRPGTSGTELNLRTHRVEAATAFQRAQRAEQEYRARRQATLARSDINTAKSSFSEAGKHLKAGCFASIGAIRLMPAVFREKKATFREKREKERKEKEEKAKIEKERREALEKKLKEEREEEEKKKKEEGEAAEASGGNGEGEEAPTSAVA